MRKLSRHIIVLLILLNVILIYSVFDLFGKKTEKIKNIDSKKVTKLLVLNTSELNLKILEDKHSHSYLNKYPFFLDCTQNIIDKWTIKELKSNNIGIDFTKPAPLETHEKRIVRGILIYFPIEKASEFEYEFKWLYKSRIEMQKYEPLKWRTDIIIFIENDPKLLNSSAKFLIEMGCSFTNQRKSQNDKPMCTLMEYIPIKKRLLKPLGDPIFNPEYIDSKAKYHHLLDKVNIFNNDETNLLPFYSMVQESLKDYGYTDSILMAFDGYNYLNSAGYDYLIRSDMDVFLTPLFSIWLPTHCNDFYVGGGAYSTDFNRKRLKRIAKDLNIEHGGVSNLGSTWISTPHQFRIVSYLTLFGMAYISGEEFSLPERQGKLGTELWPYWHYGVLLLYGQNLGLNHLIGSNQSNVVKINTILDYPSSNSEPINSKIHIHVFHGDDVFSKFVFKVGKYDNTTVPENLTDQIKYYCLKMALDAKRAGSAKLLIDFINENSKKN